MPDELYDELIDEFSRMKSYRESRVDASMREKIELVVPKYGTFPPDAVWTDHRFDSCGTEDAWLVAEGLAGNTHPADQPWFEYMPEEPNAGSGIGKYLEKLTEYMIPVFERSTFYDVGPEIALLGATMPCVSLDVHEDKDSGRIICSTEHPRAVYVKTNAFGQVVTVYVREYYTAEQAADAWGEDKLDRVLKTDLANGTDTEYEFLEIVRKRKKYDNQSKLAKEWMWGEYVIRTGDDTKTIYEEAGCREFPKPTWRWSTRGVEPYAWTPADDAMPDIRTCNQIVRTMLMTYQANADPARVLPEEGRTWSTNPGAKNFARDVNRKPYTFEPGNARYDSDLLLGMREKVRQAFKVNHFLMLMQQEREMTAREVLERKRESMSVVSSVSGKYNTEMMNPLHKRFLDLEFLAHRAPMPPNGLRNIKIRYSGPIAKQQRQVFMQEGIIGSLESIIPIITVPQWAAAADKLKASMMVEKIFESNGGPKEVLRTEEEYAKIQEAKAEQAAKAEQQKMKEELARGTDPNAKPQAGSPAAQMLGGRLG